MRKILIAGGGASGVLLAASLVRSSKDISVVIAEPRERLGEGVAYSTRCPAHLLNVPAANISAFPDEPDHFVQWLESNRPGSFARDSFVPRSVYGDYLNAIATREERSAGETRWRHVRESVCGAEVTAAGVRATLSNGDTIVAERLIIATGNAAPAAWPAAPESSRYFSSAWEPGALIPATENETVLLLGTGLTAVDAVLGLQYNGHRGKIFMVSRRGLFPHEHRLFDAPPAASPDAASIRDLIVAARRGNWRATLDAMRHHTNTFWRAQALADQRRFIRHLMPYWNVHRHRLAPEAAKQISDQIAAGNLRILAGRTGEMTAAERGLRVPIALRGEKETLEIEAGRVINCSGPEHDFRKLPNPLIRNLLEQGLMTPHPLGIGVDVAENGALIDAASTASERLFAIGPVRYGTLIETTAIPEIRVQAHELSRVLADDTRTEAAS